MAMAMPASPLPPEEELAIYRAVYGPNPEHLITDFRRASHYAPPRISIRNDLRLPEGFELSYQAEVRFQTGASAPYGHLTAAMRTTRQQGLVEISPYTGSVRADLLSGMLYLSESR
jgi:hypothetical protein